ncbi:hypothetical protein pdam_00018771 [Pocillopora damicornis]|uniref:Uncharacterized protein n=1 Tax=Pocillopora damicornis TaxID=46731 RepID=A0A3M6T590_POCDA|nr:hypothetical protein pdam_00018771 [Pocillopora damicornis]
MYTTGWSSTTPGDHRDANRLSSTSSISSGFASTPQTSTSAGLESGNDSSLITDREVPEPSGKKSLVGYMNALSNGRKNVLGGRSTRMAVIRGCVDIHKIS